MVKVGGLASPHPNTPGMTCETTKNEQRGSRSWKLQWLGKWFIALWGAIWAYLHELFSSIFAVSFMLVSRGRVYIYIDIYKYVYFKYIYINKCQHIYIWAEEQQANQHANHHDHEQSKNDPSGFLLKNELPGILDKTCSTKQLSFKELIIYIYISNPTSPKFNSSPLKKRWLEDDPFRFGKAYFHGLC